MAKTKKHSGKPGHPLAYYCHTVISKDGKKIFFLARSVDWFDKNTHTASYWETTSLTVNRDGTDLRRCFRDAWQGSHFNWAPDGSHKMLVTAVWDGDKKGRPWSQTAWSLVEFTVGEEKQVVKKGDSLYVASNVPHGTLSLEDGSVVVDIFSPIREDFLKK